MGGMIPLCEDAALGHIASGMADEARLNPLVSQVVIAALREQGTTIPSSVIPSDTVMPVSRAQQYALLEYADRSLAPVGVLKIGRIFIGMLDRFPNPLLLVLLNQDSVNDLLDQIARLNRFFHSAHRHEVVARSDGLVRLRHVSIHEGSPEPLESRFVFGLYLALLQEIGCEDIRGAIGEPELEVYGSGVFKPAPDPTASAGLWHFRWASFAAVRKRLPGLDKVLLQSLPEDLEPPATLRGRVESLIRRDLCARHTISEIAKRIAISTRSLQRQLRAESVSFSEIVDSCRVSEAERLLKHTRLSVTEIGFTCGFSDTAHFSRRFKVHYGEPPTAYRERHRGLGG